MEIANLRDLNLEHHWEKKLDLQWNILLVQDLDLWEVLEVLLMAAQIEKFLHRYLRRVHQGRL